MIIIPEIQIRDGKVITREAIESDDTLHAITPQQAVDDFVADGAQMLQIVDVDAARSNPARNEELIKDLSILPIFQSRLRVVYARYRRSMTGLRPAPRASCWVPLRSPIHRSWSRLPAVIRAASSCTWRLGAAMS